MNYVNKYWATFGGIIAFIILIIIFYFNCTLPNIQKLAWLHLVSLLLHQFEEYSFPGKFKFFYNTHILNKNPITRFPLTDKGVLVVNVILAWTIYFIASLFQTSFIWLNIGLIGVTLLNGIMHTIMFLKLKMYNPGLLTGFFILIPFGFYYLFILKDYVNRSNLLIGLVVFIIGTASIPLSIFLTNSPKR